MKKIVVIPNSIKDKEYKVTALACDKLISLGLKVSLSEKYRSICTHSVEYYDSFPTDADLIIVVGGDGSIIDATKYSVRYSVPILGINLGKVGYLSEVEPQDLSPLDSLVTGEYAIEERMLIEALVIGDSKDTMERQDIFAVNDVVISHDTYLGLADIKLEDSFGNAIKYRADGVILSTPLGSTAYSLSAGGPIVAHNVDSILVTPVCAHSFFNRSVLFSADELIKVTNIGNGTLNVSIDGRHFAVIDEGGECLIKRSCKRIKMLTFSNNRMFSNLFKKMKMLEDIK